MNLLKKILKIPHFISFILFLYLMIIFVKLCNFSLLFESKLGDLCVEVICFVFTFTFIYSNNYSFQEISFSKIISLVLT